MRSEAQSSDGDLSRLRRIAEGDRVAFQELYESYGTRVYGFTLRTVRDPALAEEVTQDVLVEVWKSASRFRGDSRVSTWIFGIAHNKALAALRRRPRETDELDAEVASVNPGPDIHASRAGMADLMKSALAHLSEDHRAVIELAFYEGFSYPEIAQIVGCPPNTVKTRMFHAKKHLQRVLRRFGIDHESLRDH